MFQLQCPRCSTRVDFQPTDTPTCPKCGFQGEVPPKADEMAAQAPKQLSIPAEAPYLIQSPRGAGSAPASPASSPEGGTPIAAVAAPKKSNKTLWIVLAIVAVLLLVGGAAAVYFLSPGLLGFVVASFE